MPVIQICATRWYARRSRPFHESSRVSAQAGGRAGGSRLPAQSERGTPHPRSGTAEAAAAENREECSRDAGHPCKWSVSALSALSRGRRPRASSTTAEPGRDMDREESRVPVRLLSSRGASRVTSWDLVSALAWGLGAITGGLWTLTALRLWRIRRRQHRRADENRVALTAERRGMILDAERRQHGHRD